MFRIYNSFSALLASLHCNLCHSILVLVYRYGVEVFVSRDFDLRRKLNLCLYFVPICTNLGSGDIYEITEYGKKKELQNKSTLYKPENLPF